MFKEIRERLKKATPGPLTIEPFFEKNFIVKKDGNTLNAIAIIENGSLNSENNKTFFVSAPSYVSTLLQSLDDALPILKFVADSCFGPKSEEARELLERWEGK